MKYKTDKYCILCNETNILNRCFDITEEDEANDYLEMLNDNNSKYSSKQAYRMEIINKYWGN